MRLSQLIVNSGQFENLSEASSDVDVTGISFDSREVRPGDIFIALEGGRSDGHLYIPQAITNGACAVVGGRAMDLAGLPYFQTRNPRQAMAHLAAALNGFPARTLTVIGVTGTDGKTTTVNLIFQILLSCGVRAGMISTVNAVIGDEIIDTGFHVTTPESTVIQGLLRKMAQAGMTHVVLEATSHGLAQYRVEACEFDVAVITNITHEHMDYHGGYDGYFAAKFKLIEYLLATLPKAQGNSRCAALNADDISYGRIQERLKNPLYSVLKTVPYGLGRNAQVTAENMLADLGGLHFDLIVGNGQRTKVDSSLIGDYNIYNILGACSATSAGLGLPLKCAAEGVSALQAVPGRMEKIDLGQDFFAIVDFAHTPNALEVALKSARKLTKRRVIAVFGSAGLRDRQKRRMMAAVSAKLADVSILTAEDPRTESLEDILSEMADEARKIGAEEGRDFLVIVDRGEAISRGVQMAQPGDLVIACGKGHEQSMCFGETEFLWDDRTAMRSALAALLGVEGPSMPFLPTSGNAQQESEK